MWRRAQPRLVSPLQPIWSQVVGDSEEKRVSTCTVTGTVPATADTTSGCWVRTTPASFPAGSSPPRP